MAMLENVKLSWCRRQSPAGLVFLVTVVSMAAVAVGQSDDVLALVEASMEGNAEEVRRMVGEGVNINVVDDTQTTPLHWAAFRGHTNIVEFMVENGALVNTFDSAGFSPLDSAAEANHVKIARSLIQAGATIDVRNVEGRTPLYAAASEGNLGIVRLLLGAGAQVEARYAPTDGTPIIIAAALGFDEIVEQLIQSEADWNATARSGDFPLFVSAQNGHVEVVKMLIEAGVNVNRATLDGSVPLMIASQNGHVEIVKILLDAKARPGISNDLGDTALHKAPVKFDNPEMINALVDGGADVSLADNRGDTPLHMATQFGAVKSVEALLAADADPLLPNFDLELPEDIICECLEFVAFPNSLQCPEGSCSDDDKEAIRKLLNPEAANDEKKKKKKNDGSGSGDKPAAAEAAAPSGS